MNYNHFVYVFLFLIIIGKVFYIQVFEYKKLNNLANNLNDPEIKNDRNNKKSIVRSLVRQLTFVDDEETLEKLETKIFESESSKQIFGYLD